MTVIQFSLKRGKKKTNYVEYTIKCTNIYYIYRKGNMIISLLYDSISYLVLRQTTVLFTLPGYMYPIN